MMHFPKTQALLPKLLEAERTFDADLAHLHPLTTNADVYAAADKLNAVIREAVEAFVQDTAGVNSRSTIESIYLRRDPMSFTLGGLSHAAFKHACETGRAP